MRSRNALFALVGLVIGLLAASRIPLHARKAPQEATPPATAEATPGPKAGKPSIQAALLTPYSFDFARPTTLEAVARRLAADLGGRSSWTSPRWSGWASRRTTRSSWD